MTRGCFRKCEFCVNKKYDRAFKASNPAEFVDSHRKRILLLDDNVLACPDWWDLLNQIEAFGKPFQFNQGLDIRLLTNRSAVRFADAKTFGDIIFAFDSMKDAQIIDRNLWLWRRFSNKTTKLYVLCGFESQDENDIVSVFERLKIIMKHDCLPYLMRHEQYKKSKFRSLYIQLARWCNQPWLFRKMSFREFCERDQKTIRTGRVGAALKALKEFEEEFPLIAAMHFDLKYSEQVWRNSND